MHDANITGTWDLVGAAETTSQARLIGEDTDPADLDAWLNGYENPLHLETAPASGLQLRIDTDAFVEERSGSPTVPWFDAEGVLTEEVTPFDGTPIGTADGTWLRPAEIPSWAMPVADRHGAAVLRYDDGDTKIADSVRAFGDRLIRTVNVVTDELYLNRVTLIYARHTPATEPSHGRQ